MKDMIRTCNYGLVPIVKKKYGIFDDIIDSIMDSEGVYLTIYLCDGELVAYED